jgi:hypothetical protein
MGRNHMWLIPQAVTPFQPYRVSPVSATVGVMARLLQGYVWRG